MQRAHRNVAIVFRPAYTSLLAKAKIDQVQTIKCVHEADEMQGAASPQQWTQREPLFDVQSTMLRVFTA